MRLDMHVHTKYSPDSKTGIKEVLKTVLNKKLDGLAITDHNSLDGYMKARVLANKMNLVLVPGYEIKTRDGELLVYGIEELVPQELPVIETIELVHELGGLVVAPHPFDMLRKGLGDLCSKLDLDGLEVLNSHSLNNTQALRLARELGLAQLGGSDAHISWEIGDAYTECSGNPITAIKKGKCSAHGVVSFKKLLARIFMRILGKPGSD